MKKILGVMVVVTMFFPGALAYSANCNYPQVVVDNWSTLSSEAKQAYTNEYCSGTTGVAAPTGQTVPTGSTPKDLTAVTKLQNPIKYSTFSDFAAAVTKAAVQMLMPFVVLGFIYSGFLFVRAQGNEAEITKAKTAITYSMLGAFILLGAWGFAQIISQTVTTLTQ